MSNKKCNICHKIKSILEFGKDKYTKDSHGHRCKKCNKERNKKWRESNKEKRSIYDKWHRNTKRNEINATRRKNKRNHWHTDTRFRFDPSKSEEQKKCFHHTNSQILTAEENISKGNR